MEQFIIGFYFIAFIMGFSFIILSFFLWLNNRKQTLKFLLISAFALTLILFQQMISAYDMINIVFSKTVNIIFMNVSSIGCGLMIYALTKLVSLLLERNLSKKLEYILRILSILQIVFVNIYLLIDVRFVLWISNIILFTVILYNIIILVINSEQLQNIIKNIIRWIAVVTLIMLPFLFLDTLIEKLPGIGDHFKLGIFSVLIYYFTISGIGFYYLIKYHNIILNIPAKKMELVRIADIGEKISGLNITNRESEIIILLMEGNSYQKISDKLVISLPTVKTHVHNIYKKLEVRNKIELMHLLSESMPKYR